MKGRFKCSSCSGTLDAPDSRFPPPCPTHQGAMTLVSQGMSLPGEPTGCRFGMDVADMGLRTFLSRGPFTCVSFVPHSGRGKFNFSYDPKVGVIDIAIHFSHASPDTGPSKFQSEGRRAEFAPPEPLSSKELLKVETDLKESIATHWNGKCRFQCTKPGWTNLMAAPRFTVQFGTETNSHFRLRMSKESKQSKEGFKQFGGRECQGYVSLTQVTSGDPTSRDDAILRDFMVQDFNYRLGGMTTAGNDRERLEVAITASNMVKNASARPVHGPSTVAAARNGKTPVAGAIPFADNDATLSLAATTLLTDFSREANKQVPESHPITIYLKGCSKATEASPATLAETRARAVQTFLKRQSIPNPISLLPGIAAAAAAEVEIAVDWTYEKQIYESGVFAYNVAAHEFGHMLGLPDEYENPVAGVGAKPEDIAKEQVKLRYLELTGWARTGHPTFPSNTMSMMSNGMVLMNWHFVTIWEALVRLTWDYIDPEEWSIYVPH